MAWISIYIFIIMTNLRCDLTHSIFSAEACGTCMAFVPKLESPSTTTSTRTTVEPSASPIISTKSASRCTDDTRFYAGNEHKTCDWVRHYLYIYVVYSKMKNIFTDSLKIKTRLHHHRNTTMVGCVRKLTFKKLAVRHVERHAVIMMKNILLRFQMAVIESASGYKNKIR